MIKTLDILNKWVERVNAGDVDGLVNMYDTSATLFPTFSPTFIATLEGIREYFVKMASKADLVVQLHEETVAEHHIGESAVSMYGIYTFTCVVDGAEVTFPSRFTFVLDKTNEYKILHHHSSQIPRGIS